MQRLTQPQTKNAGQIPNRRAILAERDPNATHHAGVNNASILPARSSTESDIFSEGGLDRSSLFISAARPADERPIPSGGRSFTPVPETDAELPALAPQSVLDAIFADPETPGGVRQKSRSEEKKRLQAQIYQAFNGAAKDLLRAYTALADIRRTGRDGLELAQSKLIARWSATEAAALRAAECLDDHHARRGRKFHLETGFFIALPLAYYLKYARVATGLSEIEDNIRAFTPYIRLSHQGVLRAEDDGASEMFKVKKWLKAESFWDHDKKKSAAPEWIRKPLTSL